MTKHMLEIRSYVFRTYDSLTRKQILLGDYSDERA